jgi:hypothetical protein
MRQKKHNPLCPPFRFLIFLLSLFVWLGGNLHEVRAGNALQPFSSQVPAITILDIRDFGHSPIHLPVEERTAQMPAFLSTSPTLISKTAPTIAAPNTQVKYIIALANTDHQTHTYQLDDPLPPELTYIPHPSSDLTYDPNNHMLTWQGDIPPGNLDYLIEESATSLPYLDLAAFGIPNLCDDLIQTEGHCENQTITFNLGVNGYSYTLYGEQFPAITLSTEGILLAESPLPHTFFDNQQLPNPDAPNLLLAGLWRDVDMTNAGRWHAAILDGYLADHTVFYAQWHDAPHYEDINLTARHAIVIVLDGNGDFAGHIFYLYDNISAPSQTVAKGFTIGIEDRVGGRGKTYAYAPCCGDTTSPQGWTPTAGTTLQLRPVLFSADNAYQKTFTYTVQVNAPLLDTVINTAFVESGAPDPYLASGWATHYLHIRWQIFLPLLSLGQ